MRALYFDCYAGISGDMIIGALIDLGVRLELIADQLLSLGLEGYRIKADKVMRSQIAATKFGVEIDDRAQPARHLDDIISIIDGSRLSHTVKSLSKRVFERLAEAEARVHGTTSERVHFHEVGAVDSIIDIVGAMIGFEELGIEVYYSSRLRVGRGSIEAAHGLLPVPAPGTAELLRGVPIYAGALEGEFVTPTGAAIVTTLCEHFIPIPQMKLDRTGYGAGARDPEGFPNTLRLILGETEQEQAVASAEHVLVIETNIDDMNPQVYGFVMDRAFQMGALDVFITPVQMKKNRPGAMLTVICEAQYLDSLTEMLLAETTTLGVRYYEAKRRVLARAIETVETPYGRVRIKVARAGIRTLHFHPEYEDCLRLVEQARVPLLEIQSAAIAAYRDRLDANQEKNETDGKH